MSPYVALGLGVAWVASLAGVGYWQNGAGHTAERAVWQGREIAELQAANAEIIELEETARAAEAAHAAELDKIARNHQQELADGEARKEADVAAARAGRIVLRIPAPCQSAGSGGAPEAAAAPGVGHGGATAELPREVTANLLALADDADTVVRQLAECQAVVVEDRAAR